MVIVVKYYVPKPLDVFHQIFAIPLLGRLQGCKRYCFLYVEVLSAKYIHHIIPSWDRSLF